MASRPTSARSSSTIGAIIVFVHARDDVPQSHTLGDGLKAHLEVGNRHRVDAVYWQFRTAPVAA